MKHREQQLLNQIYKSLMLRIQNASKTKSILQLTILAEDLFAIICGSILLYGSVKRAKDCGDSQTHR